ASDHAAREAHAMRPPQDSEARRAAMPREGSASLFKWIAGPPGEVPDGCGAPVPWTFAQTLTGTAIVLVPWVALNLLSQAATPATSGKAQPVSRSQDLLLGISALVITSVIEVAFLIAPFYYALSTRPPGTPPQAALHALGFRRAPLRLSL